MHTIGAPRSEIAAHFGVSEHAIDFWLDKEHARRVRERAQSKQYKTPEKSKRRNEHLKECQRLRFVYGSRIVSRCVSSLNAIKSQSKKNGYPPCGTPLAKIAAAWTGRCEICLCKEKRSNGRSSLSLDHCHKTGEFRGWICQHCNMMIGFARDNPAILEHAAAWLVRVRSRAAVHHLVITTHDDIACEMPFDVALNSDSQNGYVLSEITY